MRNNTLKLLAQKAKKRLSTAGQNFSLNNKDKVTLAFLSPANYAIVAKQQKIEEDPLFEKVKKIIDRNDITNPLAELTDYKIFNTLNQTEKERYIIDISKRYNQIKDYFLNNNAETSKL